MGKGHGLTEENRVRDENNGGRDSRGHILSLRGLEKELCSSLILLRGRQLEYYPLLDALLDLVTHIADHVNLSLADGLPNFSEDSSVVA